MANSKDPDQTASSEKIIAFICFHFINKNVWYSFVILPKLVVDKTFADGI